MNILVIGGTGFGGRYIVENILFDNFITLFKRGSDLRAHGFEKQKQMKFQNCERILGDREIEIDVNRLVTEILKGPEIECVIDLGFTSNNVMNMVDKLKEIIPYYVFISSSIVNFLEDEGKMDCGSEEINTSCQYALEKKKSEDYIKLHYPNNYLIIRSSYIAGKYDDTNRFDYSEYPQNLYFKGDKEPLSFIDGNKMAEQIQTHINTKTVGTF